jgi:hypothetical protein
LNWGSEVFVQPLARKAARGNAAAEELFAADGASDVMSRLMAATVSLRAVFGFGQSATGLPFGGKPRNLLTDQPASIGIYCH